MTMLVQHGLHNIDSVLMSRVIGSSLANNIYYTNALGMAEVSKKCIKRITLQINESILMDNGCVIMCIKNPLLSLIRVDIVSQ